MALVAKAEDTDVTFSWDPRAPKVLDNYERLEDTLSPEEKKQIIKKRKKLKESFFFPKTRYYRNKVN
jgi:hypothetical protein